MVQQGVVRDPEAWESVLGTWSCLKARRADGKVTRKRKREEGQDEDEEEDKPTECLDGHSRDTSRGVCEPQTDPVQPKPTFRVSCRSSGAVAKRFSPQVCLCDSGLAI